MHRAIFLLTLLLGACMAMPQPVSGARPMLLAAPEGPILYVRIISFQDITTGERLTADVYDVEGTLLANNVQHFEYTIKARETYTITVKTPGYQDFGFGTTALIDRDKQVIIPLHLKRK